MYRKQLEQMASGATMQNLSNTALSEMNIGLPKLSDQSMILKNIEVLSYQIDDLGASCFRKLGLLKELKRSLLQRAFAGDLTAAPSRLLDTAAE